MDTTSDTKLPVWQQLTGLDPQTERELSPEDRDEAIGTLLARTDEIIAAEFARSVPAGQRTVFWDPIDRVCALLEISRTKLSRYSMELSGLRAHERSDRQKAARLPGDLRAFIELFMAEFLKSVSSNRERPGETQTVLAACKALKQSRAGDCAARHAMDLGYANPSRLKKACLMAHGRSLEEMEREIITQLVQKFFEELTDAESGETPSLIRSASSQRMKLPLPPQEKEAPSDLKTPEKV
jgi:hypothetical protein